MMKPQPIGILVVAVFAALVVTAAAAPLNPAPAPTREQLSGTWVGFAEGSASFFRLQLEADGGGDCARTVRASGQDEVETYGVNEWTLERTKIRIDLSPRSADLPALRAEGKAGRRELTLEFKRKGSSGLGVVRLYREDYLDEVRALLRESAQADSP